MLWLSSIIICSLVFGGRGRFIDAFIISPKQQIQNVQSAASKNGDNDSEDIPTQTSYGDGISMISDCKPTRRQILGTALVGATTSLIVKPKSAHATATIATKKEMISKTLCDPSVSTWIKKYDSGGMPRTVHILGTAHISSASADLAGQIVRDIKPDVVFVELDAKRVARAIPGSNSVNSSGAITSSKVSDSVSSTSNERITSTPTPTDKANAPVTNPFINSGSKVVGNSVKNMYSKMESDGFKAGDEFAQAVTEGLASGSTIVLGDRDVEITLQRLTRALTKTDIRKLLSADSEVEKAMAGLLPESMENKLKQTSEGGGDITTISKDEMSSFVETMKAKDNVKAIMNALRQTAPGKSALVLFYQVNSSDHMKYR